MAKVDSGLKMLIKWLVATKYYKKSFNFRNMIKLATDKATSDILKEEIDNLCVNRMTNDVAIVQIQFSTPFVTQMKLDVRLSLADKVSNIGEMV